MIRHNLDDGQVYIQELTLDRAPPVSDARWLGGAMVTADGRARIVLNASDNISRRGDLKYSLDGVNWQTVQNLVTVSFTGLGYKVATVYVKDQAGNAASKLLSIYNQ